MDSCIPKVMLWPRNNLPWPTKQLFQVTKKKKAPFQKAKQTGHRSDYEIYIFFRFCNKLTVMLRLSKQKYLKLLNKKSFWKGVKIVSQHKPSIPTLSEHGNVASSNHEKAKMLNDLFSKCFNYSIPPLSFAHRNDLSDVSLTDIEDISCTLEYVEHQLLLLDTSKANGSDSISARMLTHWGLGFRIYAYKFRVCM